ncbi:hypothetical protein J2S28_005666 [Rhizobium sp. SLBN-94]|nr:hypothetical protein [Rhizobium sp. SLBN-94]
MVRVEGTELGGKLLCSTPMEAVTVGAFREFVVQTSYLSDCERLGGAWVLATNGQWARKRDACWDYPYRRQTEHDPVAFMSWYDAVCFANWKSDNEGLAAAYQVACIDGTRRVEWDRAAGGYRLPTKAELESISIAHLIDIASGRMGKREWRFSEIATFPSIRRGEGSSLRRYEWCWTPEVNITPGGEGESVTWAPTVSVDRPAAAWSNECPGDTANRDETCDLAMTAGQLGFRLVRGAQRVCPEPWE